MQVIEEKYEHERYWWHVRKWTKSRLPADPPTESSIRARRVHSNLTRREFEQQVARKEIDTDAQNKLMASFEQMQCDVKYLDSTHTLPETWTVSAQGKCESETGWQYAFDFFRFDSSDHDAISDSARST
jgi:hypothetical protein